MHDHHYLDAEGMPSRHRTIQVIEALVDDVDRVRVGQACAPLRWPSVTGIDE